MTTKTCFKCLCEKPLGAFYRHAKMADGHLNKCKECAKSDVAKHRLDNIDAVRAFDKARAMRPDRVAARSAYQHTDVGRMVMRRARKAYIEKMPERQNARIKLGNALRSGLLKKLPCLCCGESKVHGHHADYSRPLDVVWLCAKHHREAHAMAL